MACFLQVLVFNVRENWDAGIKYVALLGSFPTSFVTCIIVERVLYIRTSVWFSGIVATVLGDEPFEDVDDMKVTFQLGLVVSLPLLVASFRC